MEMDIRSGDIILRPLGINREPHIITVHHVHAYPTGNLLIRYRYTSNPRGIDWSGFIDRNDPDVQLLSRGVAAVDTHTRGLLTS